MIPSCASVCRSTQGKNNNDEDGQPSSVCKAAHQASITVLSFSIRTGGSRCVGEVIDEGWMC